VARVVETAEVETGVDSAAVGSVVAREEAATVVATVGAGSEEAGSAAEKEAGKEGAETAAPTRPTR